MQVSPFDSAIYASLLSDQEAASLLSDHAQVSAMLQVEGALALAQGEVGLIPAESAKSIAEAANSLTLAPLDLAKGTASAGVPVPALVAALKAALPKEHARWVHFGATSQDIVDSALVLNLRPLLHLFKTRMVKLIDSLASIAKEHGQTLIAGRTRTQQAVPMSFGYKAALWFSPFLRHLERLEQGEPRWLKTQLSGAVGTLAAMGDKAPDVADAFARELSLNNDGNWHTQRDSLVELSGWLANTTGSLGKLGQDWLWLSQTEVGEIRFTNGGGSSTMPQKCNPVDAEAMVALARLSASLVGQMHQAMQHEHERSGSQWTQEWFVLPQQLMALASALSHAQEAIDHIVINQEKMLANLGCYNGVIYAEAATFALAEHMTRDEASAIVKPACQTAIHGDEHLFNLIEKQTGIALSVDQMRDSLVSAGATHTELTRLLAAASACVNAAQ
ncbi:MAG: class-II fumarase/aspartase family protein [Pontibacterium sp.]